MNLFVHQAALQTQEKTVTPELPLDWSILLGIYWENIEGRTEILLSTQWLCIVILLV